MRKIFFLMVLLSATHALADKARGGGSPSRVDEQAIRMMIQGESLKNSVINYFKTIKVEEIENAEIRQVVPRLLSQGLLKDVKSFDNYYFGDCLDAQDSSVPASTEFGHKDGNQCKPNIGGKICFNPNKLVSIYESEGLSEEQLLIRLASLAIHEHVHHFQCVEDSTDQKLEDQANQVAAYVQLTARLSQMPVLKWVSPMTAKSKSDLKDVIAEMQKVQFEKAEVVAALKRAQTIKLTAVFVGISSLAVAIAWPVVTQKYLNSLGMQIEYWPVTFGLVAAPETAVAAILTSAASAGVAGYFHFRHSQYQKAIEVFEKDIDKLNLQISALTGLQ